MKITSNQIEFILAGNAVFTIKNEKSGKRFTYKFTRSKRDTSVFFVKVLTGPDNTSDYSYIGLCIVGKGLRIKEQVKNTLSARAIEWYMKWVILNKLPDFISTYHEGMCGRCGRKLTVPESIESGFGPECVQIINNLKTKNHVRLDA